MYRESTVSLMSTSHCFCSSRGPVSRPSSAQKMENPALLSPSIRVLQSEGGEEGRGEEGRGRKGGGGREGGIGRKGRGGVRCKGR